LAYPFLGPNLEEEAVCFVEELAEQDIGREMRARVEVACLALAKEKEQKGESKIGAAYRALFGRSPMEKAAIGKLA